MNVCKGTAKLFYIFISIYTFSSCTSHWALRNKNKLEWANRVGVVFCNNTCTWICKHTSLQSYKRVLGRLILYASVACHTCTTGYFYLPTCTCTCTLLYWPYCSFMYLSRWQVLHIHECVHTYMVVHVCHVGWSLSLSLSLSPPTAALSQPCSYYLFLPHRCYLYCSWNSFVTPKMRILFQL